GGFALGWLKDGDCRRREHGAKNDAAGNGARFSDPSGTSPRAPAELLLAARALDSLRDRALREDAAEVRLVLDRSLKVGLDVDAFGALRARRPAGRGLELLPHDPRLDALGPNGLRAGAGDCHARLRALAFLVERHHRGGTDERET